MFVAYCVDVIEGGVDVGGGSGNDGGVGFGGRAKPVDGFRGFDIGGGGFKLVGVFLQGGLGFLGGLDDGFGAYVLPLALGVGIDMIATRSGYLPEK